MSCSSLLDTDLYKLTMQCAVQAHFPNAIVSYTYINRARDHQRLISLDCFQLIQHRLSELENRILTDQERDWLEEHCSYFPKSYLDYLSQYRFKPSQHLKLSFLPDPSQAHLGELEIKISGLWLDTILYEVPILAIISTTYFEIMDQDWNYDHQIQRATQKALKLLQAGCQLAEFGTRRRRSFQAQKLVIEALVLASSKSNQPDWLGTSNVYFAMTYHLKPIGTIAHEFIMAIAALEGYPASNLRALELWETCFGDHSNLLIALTDTFSTKPFFDDLASDPQRAQRWTGLRQDSGDPKVFSLAAKQLWIKMGIDPMSKLIVFSDGLDIERCLDLRKFCESEGINESYGIGTHLTNDFKRLSSPEPSKALNIVIKLSTINSKPCIKLSDDLSKSVGSPETIDMVKNCFGL